MASSSNGVWGIEIGQTSLKALHCTMSHGEVVADAFDLIEYPKILSQPEADAEELINDALLQLIDRNDASGSDKVCISVPGQSGLAKFFKPPPVEVKKIADIVRYEARQQIPFDLADVVWDFQMMPGSMVEEGYALESEVGLFAMKREMAYRQLAPFQKVDLEVDQVQLAPLALYNMVAYDRLNERVDNDVFDIDNPPPSTVILSIGTDSSDLIVTNGFRIWQRSMPIGGNHFTRQLTKDLKLTFAKAEHLKRNAREAVDPKLIFQTMRPVFNDLVTEVQRSIGFFRSLDKKAEITELLITGNTVKMPGLAAYMGKNLGFDVEVIDRFNRLGGEDVMAIPTFRDNAPTFAVCYGLCLQGLGVSQVHASLVPREILTQRLIRAKKPWTIAALSALLIGMTGHYMFTQKSWATTEENLWKPATLAVSNATSHSSEQISTDSTLDAKLTYLNEMGNEVSGNAERRLKWLEILQVVTDAIPRMDPDGGKDMAYEDRKDIQVVEIETQYYKKLGKEWFTDELADRYRAEVRDWRSVTGRPMSDEELDELEKDEGPDGPGWVIQLNCYHYYNSDKLDRRGFEENNHVRLYMTTNFMEKTVKVPIGKDEKGAPIYETFTMEQMGLQYPLLLDVGEAKRESIPNPAYEGNSMMGMGGPMMGGPMMGGPMMGGPMMGAEKNEETVPATLEVKKLNFIFQVVWQEKTLAERLEAKQLALEEAEKAKEKEKKANQVASR